ncbi:MAG: serine/threonine protein kinase [Planctomycetota bacterium]|nr:MAG: serine/threonine protein kinase [Planctomycetota bacterium]
MAVKLSAETFFEVLGRSQLVPDLDLEKLRSELREQGVDIGDAGAVAEALVDRGMLTRWQAEKLLRGKYKGLRLGPYRLLNLLGRGGMGAVYLAEHMWMKRRCAIKVLPSKNVSEASYLERFYREAQAVAALDHPNIVRAYDVNKDEQGETTVHFLVMEYVDGEDLHRRVVKNGVLDYVTAADYIRQAALGLHHAHENNLIHRDIKPANLLVDRRGTVKILDLGLARFFGDSEGESLTIAHDERVLGTADYLAPEQALNSHEVDARADIYSLGCTFYFLLTGHPPFTEETVAQRLLAHQLKPVPPLTNDRPDAPPELVAIIEKMMAKDPAERFQTAGEVAEALTQWLAANAGEAWSKEHHDLVSGIRSTITRTDTVSATCQRVDTDVASSDTGLLNIDEDEVVPLADDEDADDGGSTQEPVRSGPSSEASRTQPTAGGGSTTVAPSGQAQPESESTKSSSVEGAALSGASAESKRRAEPGESSVSALDEPAAEEIDLGTRSGQRITATCDVCFHVFDVPRRARGRRVKCPSCGCPVAVAGGSSAAIVAPASAEDIDSAIEAAAPLSGRSRRRPRKPAKEKSAKAKHWWHDPNHRLIAGCATLVVLLVLLGFVYWPDEDGADYAYVPPNFSVGESARTSERNRFPEGEPDRRNAKGAGANGAKSTVEDGGNAPPRAKNANGPAGSTSSRPQPSDDRQQPDTRKSGNKGSNNSANSPKRKRPSKGREKPKPSQGSTVKPPSAPKTASKASPKRGDDNDSGAKQQPAGSGEQPASGAPKIVDAPPEKRLVLLRRIDEIAVLYTFPGISPQFALHPHILRRAQEIIDRIGWSPVKESERAVLRLRLSVQVSGNLAGFTLDGEVVVRSGDQWLRVWKRTSQLGTITVAAANRGQISSQMREQVGRFFAELLGDYRRGSD